MNDERLRALYQHSLGDRIESRRLDCPSARELAGLADETAPRSHRIALVRHIARCLPCSSEFNRLCAAEHAAALSCGPALTLVGAHTPFPHSIEGSPT